jgi:hypothetical protein
MALISLKFSTFNKGSFFSHVFSKTCQYVCNDTNVCWFLKYQFDGNTICPTKNNHTNLKV